MPLDGQREIGAAGDARQALHRVAPRGPGVVEIVRRINPAQPRRLDADRLHARRDDRVRAHEGRAQDDIPATGPAPRIDLETGERRTGEGVVGDAGLYGAPQHAALHVLPELRQEQEQANEKSEGAT